MKKEERKPERLDYDDILLKKQKRRKSIEASSKKKRKSNKKGSYKKNIKDDFDYDDYDY